MTGIGHYPHLQARPIDAREALARVKCFLLDMDGTFYLGERIFGGSLGFIERLEETGRDYVFLTNNSSHNGAFYVERLKRMGLEVPSRRVFTSGQATAIHLNRAFTGRRVFLLGNEYLRGELNAAGVNVVDDNPEVVVVGFDTTLNYAKMTRVCDLVRAGLPYVATHPDFNCPVEGGFIPDIGAIMAFIEAATGRKADVIVGKPHAQIVNSILAHTGYTKDELAMVGDRLYTDILTGRDHGILSILVLTGETTEGDAEASGIKADLVFGGLGDMVGVL